MSEQESKINSEQFVFDPFSGTEIKPLVESEESIIVPIPMPEGAVYSDTNPNEAKFQEFLKKRQESARRRKIADEFWDDFLKPLREFKRQTRPSPESDKRPWKRAV